MDKRTIPWEIDRLDVEMGCDADLENILRAEGADLTPRDVITVEMAQEITSREDAFDHLAVDD